MFGGANIDGEVKLYVNGHKAARQISSWDVDRVPTVDQQQDAFIRSLTDSLSFVKILNSLFKYLFTLSIGIPL
jgi:hypothetical protein